MAKSKIQRNMEETRARVLADLQKKGTPRITAQTMFLTIARAMGNRVRRHAIADLTACKPVIRAMITADIDQSHYAAGQTSVHEQAGRLIASRPWVINIARLEEAETRIAEGYQFHDGEWKPAQKDDDSYQAQVHQVEAIREILTAYGAVVSFDVSTDDRGRYYVRGGYASPYMGKLGRWIYTQEDEICLDHRTSFAQNFSLLTGTPWGLYCGVGDDHPTDFWSGVLSQWGATVQPNTITRKACKAYGTPTFYGAGKETAREKSYPLFYLALAKGEITPDECQKIKEALEQFGDIVASFGEKTRDYAHSFVEWNEHPHWETPSGFIACKKYFSSKTIVWNSGDNSTLYYPKSMTLMLKTGRICERPAKDSTDKSVLVATCANILQSSDASIMAKTIIKFHEKTGLVLFPLHDSYTVPKEHKQTLIRCVIESMREVADSDQIKELRSELNLLPVKVITGKAKIDPDMINLDMRKMNPLDEE